MGKPRHIIWREEYRKNRYLAGKPPPHIVARLRALVETMMALSPNGKIGINTSPVGLWLTERFTHTLEEFQLRGLQPPDGFMADANVPNISFPNPAPEYVAYQNRKRREPGQIFKFGKKKWMQLALSQGSFRFAGAAYYADPSLNAAIQDDELSFTVYPASTAPIGIMGVPTGATPGAVTLSHPTDFYVQCFSSQYSLRMFKDFSADACLIVYDAKEFGRRVMSQLRTAFPTWIIGAIPVAYVDPDDPGSAVLPIPAAKHMKYAYQCEERIVCHPRTNVFKKLHPITIEAGPLTDIAEVIET